MLFYFAQAMGLLVFIFTVIGVQFKNKEKIIIFYVFANLFMVIEYLLLSAWTGAATATICLIRCFVFYLYTRKNKRPPIYVLIILEILVLVSGIITWENAWSIIPILVSMVNTYGMWQENIYILKASAGFAGLGLTVYNLVVKAYVGAIQQAIQFISSIISIILLKINKNKISHNEQVSQEKENLDNKNQEKELDKI